MRVSQILPIPAYKIVIFSKISYILTKKEMHFYILAFSILITKLLVYFQYC